MPVGNEFGGAIQSDVTMIDDAHDFTFEPGTSAFAEDVLCVVRFIA